MIKNLVKVLPAGIRRRVRQYLVSMVGGTVTQGWEQYAQNFKSNNGKHLGDEWNEPEVYGLDITPDQIVPTLDITVFQPFLGTCETILEIGPGGGRFTEILIPKCNKVIVADTSPTMLDLVKDRFKACTNLEYVLLDGRGLGPISDKSIDNVFSCDVFVHLEQWDIFNYLLEIKRVLKPNGKALIHHANTFSELGWKRFVADLPQQLNVPKVWGTFSVMTPQLFKELAERAGLEYVNCITDVIRRDGISLLRSPTS